MTKENTTTDLSVEELEKLLADKKKAQKEAQRKAREEYETRRDDLVNRVIEEAKELNRVMREFKDQTIKELDKFAKEAHKYGDIRSNSKGGFGLRSIDQSKKVVYRRNTKNEYDERAQMAEELIKEFLEDKVKKRFLADYKFMMSLLARNKQGEFEQVSINTIIKNEDNYDDPRWNKAIQLFKESYNNIFTKMSIEFFEKDKQQKDQPISLTFASL